MKYYVEEAQKHSSTYTEDELLLAIKNGEILYSRALALDSQKQLHVSLGEIEGIIPYEECADGIASGEVREIALITRVGKTICFTVTSLNMKLSPPRAILSRAKAQELCKANYLNNLVPGDIIPCKVTHIEGFGAFCDVGCGISALAPIDCLSVSRIRSVRDRINVGQQLNCVVKGRDVKGRLVLSLKELLGSWSENAEKFSAGDTVIGIVRSCEAYGVFVELAPNLAGLAEERNDLLPGQVVSVFIKSILPEKMKIKLTILSVCESEDFIFPIEYFLKSNHISRWEYSPPCSLRMIAIDFD